MIVEVDVKENQNILEVYNTAVANLMNVVRDNDNRPEDIQAYILKKLTLKTQTFHSMTKLLANYIAIISMLINCRSTKIWGGPMADPEVAPVSKIMDLQRNTLF